MTLNISSGPYTKRPTISADEDTRAANDGRRKDPSPLAPLFRF